MSLVALDAHSTLTDLRERSRSPSPEGHAADLREVYRELENLEMSLVSERQRLADVSDSKAACEAAHARDIAALEGMLKQVVDERDRLSTENLTMKAEIYDLRKMLVEPMVFDAALDTKLPQHIGTYFKVAPSSNLHSPAHSMSYEPEMERSIGPSSFGEDSDQSYELDVTGGIPA